jgi:hypothetical protein
MSLNADKAAPIAVSVEERRRIWALPEVEVLLEEQTKVSCSHNILVNGFHFSAKAKRACIAAHGSVGSAEGTPEGECYRLAYSAAKTAIARHERHSFAIERKHWFANQDTRLLASNPMASNLFHCVLLTEESLQPLPMIEEPLSELPTTEQEADINNLDILAVRDKYGHIDYNEASGVDIAEIFDNGALTSAINASIIMDQHSAVLPNNKPTTSTRLVPALYDSLIHYPPDIFQKLFAGGYKNSGTLSDRFAAWKELAMLPAIKAIPKHTITSHHYKGEIPTEDLRCPIEGCGNELWYVHPFLHRNSLDVQFR